MEVLETKPKGDIAIHVKYYYTERLWCIAIQLPDAESFYGGWVKPGPRDIHRYYR